MMKKHISVFGLFARSSIYRVLGILLLMVTAEIGVFVWQVKEAVSGYYELLALDLAAMPDLERVVDKSGLFLCFAIALILITVVLCLPGCELGSKTSYTLKRLSISERATFFHQAAYNILVYIFLFATQIVLAFTLCTYYARTVPAAFVGNQTVFLAFYRNEFLHAVLPLSDVMLWIRNAFLILALGACAAEFPFRQRRKQYALSIAGLVIYMFVFFSRTVGDLFNCILTIIVALILIAEMLYTVCRKEREVVSEDG